MHVGLDTDCSSLLVVASVSATEVTHPAPSIGILRSIDSYRMRFLQRRCITTTKSYTDCPPTATQKEHPMSGFNNILTMLGNAAKQLLPAIVPGSGALIAGAEALSKAFTSIKAANGGTAPAEADAAHSALYERVKAHSDSTFSRLEGGGS